MGRWVELGRADIGRVRDHRIRLLEGAAEGHRVLVVEGYQEDKEDVTSDCTVELVQSKHSRGYYCNVLHQGRSILALGVDNASKCIMKRGYRVEKAEGATVSFRIFKKS